MIIVLNEEKNITDCLKSVSFSDEVIVVDSGSIDRTASLAQGMGAKVFKKDFQDFASQKNFGIDHAGSDWLLLIDADERVTPALGEEIRQAIADPKAAEAYFFMRRNNIFGRWMRFGINRSDWQLRLIRRNSGRFEGLFHERISFSGKAMKLKNHLLHFSSRTISDYMNKLINYYLKTKAWQGSDEKIPTSKLLVRPFLVFCNVFFIKLGLLDGLEGFLFSVLSAYYDFVRLARYTESNLKNGVIA